MNGLQKLPKSDLLVCVDKRLAFEFMQSKLNLRAIEDFQGAIFVRPKVRGELMQMKHVAVAYAWHSFIGRTCVINIVVQDKECLTKAVIREAFRYPFNTAGCNAVLALVDSVNVESMSLCERTGFKLKTTIKDGGLEGDLLVYEMCKDDCRWLRQEH